MSMDRLVYLDNNATTRVLPEVLAAMLPYFSDTYFNPSSPVAAMHDAGRPLREARANIAKLIDCFPEEIVLTSGATESNNWVLQTVARKATRESGRCHIVISAIEHPSVLEVAAFLSENIPGVEVDQAPVTKEGLLDLKAFRQLLQPHTALVSLMLANNETGVIQPVAEAATITREICPGCIIHSDATQAVGKIAISLRKELEEVDCLSLSAHKFHGPKGIGALFKRGGVSLDPLLYGGGQQDGMRAGTENPALAAGIAKAAELTLAAIEPNRIADLRDQLESLLTPLGVTILAAESPRLPNTSLILFPDTDAEMLIHQLLEEGFAISNGSACSAGSDKPSHVVLAMGIDYSSASSVFRVSLGLETTEFEITSFVETILSLVNVDLQTTVTQ